MARPAPSRNKKLSNSKKRQLHALLDQAVQYLNQAQMDICEQLCLRIDSLQAENADATNIRGVIANQQGDSSRALELFRMAVEAAPRRHEFHANLASVLLSAGQQSEALSTYQRALKLKPHHLHSQLGCAGALIALKHFDEAQTLMAAAHIRHPHDTEILMKLFRACYAAGDTRQAEVWLQKLLTLDTCHVEAHYCYSLLLLEDGRKQEGEHEIRETLRLNPDHADAEGLLFELRSYHERDADVERLAEMLKQAPAQSTERARLGFVYGKVLDDLGDYDQAFLCFEQANAIRSRHSHYHQDRELAHLQLIMDTFTPEIFSQQSVLHDASPIFIVGMPRCGSTLVEQILASHPEVTARGECGYFEAAISRSNSPDAPLAMQQLTHYSSEQWQLLGQQYLQMLHAGENHAENEQSGYFTDKSLSNIRMIGAIHCALPRAKIIHVRRHPLDTCWSIFHHHLQGNLFDYGHGLESLGHYYRMYLQLMQHWRDSLPDGVLIDIDYETLVKNQEVQTGILLDACGLEWHEQCLRFYQSANTVRTASFMQVRKPVSSGSIGVWKHYEQYLQPLINILGFA